MKSIEIQVDEMLLRFADDSMFSQIGIDRVSYEPRAVVFKIGVQGFRKCLDSGIVNASMRRKPPAT